MIRRFRGIHVGDRYRVYLLGILAVILAFNYVDRYALGLVLQTIKGTFALTDTELGVLSGIAFALFYSTLGIPIGRWADRGNRIAIVSITTALWSVMVMLSGAAQSFIQLVLMRTGVAVGEAGCIPPAYSLIGDYYSRAERPRAIANYLLGGSLSIIVGYFVAGWINQIYGWRVMFAVIGLPGLILAPLALLTLDEPRAAAGSLRTPASELPQQLKTWAVFRVLWRNRTFRYLCAMECINYFFGYGINQWQPSFFIRSYGLKTGELGLWLAVIYGLGGFIGTYFGGYWASKYAAGNERLQLRVLAVLNSSFGLISALAYMANSPYASFSLIGVGVIGVTLENAPLFATAQTVVPERMRAISISVLFLFANLIGMGLGPLAVGALSDVLRASFGAESLRYALLAMCPGYLWGGWQLWQASTSVVEDIETAAKTPEAACITPCTSISLDGKGQRC